MQSELHGKVFFHDVEVLLLDTVEVHYCMVTMQWKFMSFKRSIDLNRVQNVSIRGSSSAVIQNKLKEARH